MLETLNGMKSVGMEPPSHDCEWKCVCLCMYVQV